MVLLIKKLFNILVLLFIVSCTTIDDKEYLVQYELADKTKNELLSLCSARDYSEDSLNFYTFGTYKLVDDHIDLYGKYGLHPGKSLYEKLSLIPDCLKCLAFVNVYVTNLGDMSYSGLAGLLNEGNWYNQLREYLEIIGDEQGAARLSIMNEEYTNYIKNGKIGDFECGLDNTYDVNSDEFEDYIEYVRFLLDIYTLNNLSEIVVHLEGDRKNIFLEEVNVLKQYALKKKLIACAVN